MRENHCALLADIVKHQDRALYEERFLKGGCIFDFLRINRTRKFNKIEFECAQPAAQYVVVAYTSPDVRDQLALPGYNLLSSPNIRPGVLKAFVNRKSPWVINPSDPLYSELIGEEPSHILDVSVNTVRLRSGNQSAGISMLKMNLRDQLEQSLPKCGSRNWRLSE